MNDLKYAEILSANRALAGKLQEPVFRIAVLSNIVITQLKDILEYVLRSGGINAEIVIGNFDNIVQDSADLADCSAVIVFWEAASLVDGLHAAIAGKSAAELEALTEKTEREIRLVAGNLGKVPTVLFNRFSALAFSQYELLPDALQRLCARLNATLEQSLAPGQLMVDIDSVLADVGLSQAIDFRQFLSSKALYGIPFLKAYSKFVEPVFRAVNGRARKVLVLDCDNTLWGGILGEDGVDGIRIGDATFDGRCFREAQFLIKGLKSRGVILALCTKNNPGDIDEALERRPDMVLRGDDFAARAVNWNDKASNLRVLADQLSLGLDSFVFLDDSAFELGLIATELPQVMGVAVPKNLSEYPATLRRLAREFFMPGNTTENERRTQMYREEGVRKIEAQNHTSTEDYLASLQLEVNVAWDDKVGVPRAAQLSQKTNQFNLTTRRYTDAEIARMAGDAGWSVATLNVSDRFGDYGITGLLLLRLGPHRSAVIDTFLLSCRILGRNVELAFFDHLVQKLRDQGTEVLAAEYRRTSKNDQVSCLFDRLGFRITGADEIAKQYELDLRQYRPNGVGYIKVTESD